MMHSFKLSRHRRANVWFDEAPNAKFSASSTMTRIMRPKTTFETSHRIAVVELNIPQGPKNSYALLGAELVNSSAHDLEVFVSIKSHGAPYFSSLASRFDDVTVGLPDEYASAVLKGAETIASTMGAPTGVAIRFHWAAHGQVNSSPWIFEKVSEIVMRLLLLSKHATERQVEAVFE